MLWLNFLFLVDFHEGMKRGYTDFSVFYTAGKILREGRGQQMYNRQLQYEVQQEFAGHIPFRRGPLPYIHPPFEAPLFVPLSFLSYRTAFIAWDLLNLAGLFGIALILRGAVHSLQLLPLWQIVLVGLAFFPVFICLLQGQDSILMLLFVTLGFAALQKQADVVAGIWLALAAFKFQFIVPVVLLFFLWRRKRVALGFGAIALLLGVVSVALVGVQSILDYPGFALEVVSSPALGGVPLSLLPNLLGLAKGWPSPFSGILGAVLAAASSLGLFFYAALKGRRFSSARNLPLQFSMAIIVAGLIAWQTNAHDLSLLVLPLVLLTDICFQRKQAPFLNFDLILPITPLLVSPLWMYLWLGVGKVNLVTLPLLWWVWKIGREFPREELNLAMPPLERDAALGQ